MIRPQLKGHVRYARDGEVMLRRELGVELTLPDSDGKVAALLDLLDGTRTMESIAAAMKEQWPDLADAEIAEGISDLDAAGLLENGAAKHELTGWQQERYFSNLAFFGTFASLGRSRYELQERLRRSRVLLLGVGGLGSTLLLNLAGLGVGHVTALDSDRVEPRNLARQFLYTEAEVGQPKLTRAVERARAMNSEMAITAVEARVKGPNDVAPLLQGADLVLCGIDTPMEVYDWVNEACVAARVPFIAGGMQVSRGLYYSVRPGRSGCLACRTAHAERMGGVEAPVSRPPRVNHGIGPVASTMGALVAMEAVRYLTGYAPPVSAGRLWLFDFVTGQLDVGLEWPKLPDCPVCGRVDAEA